MSAIVPYHPLLHLDDSQIAAYKIYVLKNPINNEIFYGKKNSMVQIGNIYFDENLTNDYKSGWYAYRFSINTSIHPFKFPAIKEAIEKILNEDN